MGVRALSRERAIFLDRDGVLNRAIVRDGKPYPPVGLNDLELMPGAVAACCELRRAGFLLIGVTNQPDVARGTQQRSMVERMNHVLQERLVLDEIRVCYHDDDDRCACRKPRPGMLLEAARAWSIELPASFMVGDRWKDIEAGRQAGCATVFIDHGYQEMLQSVPDVRVRSLGEAVSWILSRRLAAIEE